MTKKQEPVPERRAISIREAAKVLGVSLGGAYLAARRGELPVIKIGKRRLVPTAALDRMLGGGA